jgi:hypothetical protein
MERMKQGALAPGSWALAALALALAAGCTHRESADQALDKALAAQGASREHVAKFSGIVTVDGQPPGIKVYDKHRLVLMLYDPKTPPSAGHPILFADCMPEPNDGAFEFSTYDRGDGVAPGEYIALFVDMPTSWGGGYKGVDRFKNRFNDPDRNGKIEQFKVNLTEPGRGDWQFNLATDEPAPTAPGPKTVSKPTSK